MPVPLSSYHRPSAHPVVKAHSVPRDEAVVNESVCGFRRTHDCAIQPPCQQLTHITNYDSAPSTRLSAGDPLLTTVSNCDSSRRLSGRDIREESTGLLCGLVAAGDAVINNQRHVEAGDPLLQQRGFRSVMGLQVQDVHRPPLAEGWPALNSADGTSVGVHLLKPIGKGHMECRADGLSQNGYPATYESYSCPTFEFPTVASNGDGCAESNTPFAEYIDRMVASEASGYGGQSVDAAHALEKMPRSSHTPAQQETVTLEPHTDPVYIKEYRVMAETLSEWVADYVWKMCTAGLSLPQRFGCAKIDKGYERPTPPTLARSTYTLLCSTLLQPSAVMLSLWYIAQLPVYFDGDVAGCGVDLSASESEFRKELFSENLLMMTVEDRAAAEASAAFRLILLGCMFANKWLDDHTFSNKTWQNISDIPIRSINRLELFALSVLQHDLSINSEAWEQWLSHLHHYHVSKFPFPAPIQRPSSLDPVTCIRKILKALIDAHEPPSQVNHCAPPHPVFCSLSIANEKKAEERADYLNPVGFDFDEDGPLREEYALKRSSRSGSVLDCQEEKLLEDKQASHTSTMHLPPPSEWSPQGDPLLTRNYWREDTSVPSGSPTEQIFLGSSAQSTAWTGAYRASSYQQGGKGTATQHIYQPFSADFTLGPICLPVNHARSTLMPTIPFSGYYRSYSHSYVNGNELYYPTSNCGHYEGYPSMGGRVSGDFSHFRPLWLRI